MAMMNMSLMRTLGFLRPMIMMNQIMPLTMGYGQQRGMSGLLKYGTTGGPLEVRVHCDEPLMLCVLFICSDVNPIYV
jgi:hypothetical protein